MLPYRYWPVDCVTRHMLSDWQFSGNNWEEETDTFNFQMIGNTWNTFASVSLIMLLQFLSISVCDSSASASQSVIVSWVDYNQLGEDRGKKRSWRWRWRIDPVPFNQPTLSCFSCFHLWISIFFLFFSLSYSEDQVLEMLELYFAHHGILKMSWSWIW